MPILSLALPIAALLSATLAWASLFLVAKPLLALLDPLSLTVLRYLLAALILAPLVHGQGDKPWRKLRTHWRSLSALGVAGYGLFGTLLLVGLRHTLPSHGAVLMATVPLTTLFVRWGLDGQRPAARVLVAAVLALLGVSLVSGLASAWWVGQPVPLRALQADGLIWLSTLGWIAYTRGAAKHASFSPLEYTALTAVAATPWLLLALALGGAVHVLQWPAGPSISSWMWPMVYLACVPTVIAVLAFNVGVKRLGASTGTLFLNCVPLFALLLSALMGKTPSAAELMGTALVIGGLSLSAWSRKPAVRPMARPPAPAVAGACSALS